MGLFDSIQNLISGATDLAQGSIGDITGGLTDIVPGQEIMDQVTGLTEGVTDVATSATEQVQTSVEDITQNLGH
jgi:hypothetical protein